MKLAALALVTTLALPLGAAHAEPAPQRGQFRQLLLERFDRNHDGRLEPQERRHAIRALRRLARKLEMADHRGQGRGARARALHRFDTNHDGWLDDRDRARGAAPGVDRRPGDDRDPQ
jgi:hypothetical protein